PRERSRGHGRRGERFGPARGREGVLPRLLHRRPQELSRRQVVPAAQALAVKHYDKVETRSPKAREQALMAALPRLIGHAQKNAPGFARILKQVRKAGGEIGRAHVLNSSHVSISYAVFCLKKKNKAPRSTREHNEER